MNNAPITNTARPATPKPITAPPVKDTFSALARLVLAACVVRTFALVATFIPMYPAKAEVNAPMMKEMEIIQLEDSTNVPDQASRIAEKTTKYERIFHSAFKKAMA